MAQWASTCLCCVEQEQKQEHAANFSQQPSLEQSFIQTNKQDHHNKKKKPPPNTYLKTKNVYILISWHFPWPFLYSWAISYANLYTSRRKDKLGGILSVIRKAQLNRGLANEKRHFFLETQVHGLSSEEDMRVSCPFLSNMHFTN